MKITFFGTQPYDRESFDRANERYGFEFNYHRSHLNGNNTSLAQGADAVCIFVNDTADAATIRSLAAMDVKLIALRCAGFNNVDLKAAAEYGIPVVRVPAYSAACRGGIRRDADADAQPQGPPRLLGARATATSRCTACWDSTCTARRRVSSAPERSPAN